MYPEKLNILLLENRNEVISQFVNVFNEVKINLNVTTLENTDILLELLNKTVLLPDLVFIGEKEGYNLIPVLKDWRSSSKLNTVTVAIYSESKENEEYLLTAGANIHMLLSDDSCTFKKGICTAIKLCWQYITDGLDRENFMVSY